MRKWITSTSADEELESNGHKERASSNNDGTMGGERRQRRESERRRGNLLSDFGK